MFSRVEDDEFQIYENRVVKTLTDLILGFLRRTEKQLRDQRDQLRGIMNSGVQTGSFGFDILLDDKMRSYIAFDDKNQYIIIGRNPTGLQLTVDEIFGLKSETVDGVTMFSLKKSF